MSNIFRWPIIDLISSHTNWSDWPNMSISTYLSVTVSGHSTMDRLTILVGRLYKSVPPTNYFFKVPLVGRFMLSLAGLVGSGNPRFMCRLLWVSVVNTIRRLGVGGLLSDDLSVCHTDRIPCVPDPNLVRLFLSLLVLPAKRISTSYSNHIN